MKIDFKIVFSTHIRVKNSELKLSSLPWGAVYTKPRTAESCGITEGPRWAGQREGRASWAVAPNRAQSTSVPISRGLQRDEHKSTWLVWTVISILKHPPCNSAILWQPRDTKTLPHPPSKRQTALIKHKAKGSITAPLSFNDLEPGGNRGCDPVQMMNLKDTSTMITSFASEVLGF